MRLPVVDLLIKHGTVVTMDEQNRLIDDGALAIRGNTIVAVGATATLSEQFAAARVIDARHKVVMPGLIDTYGHAGHGLIKAIHHPQHGWPTNQLYFHATSERWWYAEGLLSALERLKAGVTCGFSVIGATPARMDSPIFAERQAQAVREVGIRGVLGVGPPDPFVHHLPEPWQATIWEGNQAKTQEVSYEQCVRNSLEVIKRWHGAAEGRIQIALHVPYLFGRQAAHPRIPFRYEDQHVPRMIEAAEEMRAIANTFGLLLHSHAFRGSLKFALKHFGIARVESLLAAPIVLAHCNGLADSEIQILGEMATGIAVVPFTHENILYGVCPVVELLRAGAKVTISTDGTAPYSSYDLFKEIGRALWAQWTEHGNQQVLLAGKALRMVTIDAARALGVDRQIGSLEVGKRADVILIDLNQPHLTPSTHIPRLLALYVNGGDVDTVIVDGKILMEGRKVKTVDEQAVLDMAREETRLAFERFEIAPYLEISEGFWTNQRD